MDRRSFLERAAKGLAAGLLVPPPYRFQTQHVILIVQSGARKKDYCENPSIAPNIGQLAAEGFVFEEDDCDTVTSHHSSFAELVHGLPHCLYAGDAARVPALMQEFKPRTLVVRETRHDLGHGAGGRPKSISGYEEYVTVVKDTDRSVGAIAQWLRRDPSFSGNTAIVIRPEFGRDDEINVFGELHHSPGFYYTHRVASIFWGPDFNTGVDRKTVVNRRDMAPTLSRLLNLDRMHARGRVLPGLFKA